jgi:hypothetical protein
VSASLLGWIWKQDLSSTAKLVLFALNEHTNIGEHGDWRIFPSQQRIAKMCGVTKPTVIKAMKELTEAEIITVAHQHDSNGRQMQNLYWLQAPKLMPEEGSNNFTPQLKNYTHGGKETLHNPLNSNPLNKTYRQKRKRFVPPTLEQVAERCQECNYGIDPNRFWNFYESQGWKVGKNPMRDWHKALAGWQSREGNQTSRKSDFVDDLTDTSWAR